MVNQIFVFIISGCTFKFRYRAEHRKMIPALIFRVFVIKAFKNVSTDFIIVT